MKKITKILVTTMFASLLSFSTQAGELTVTGGVTATITKGGADMASGTGIGISNELDFAASGELDNGYRWNYLTQLDGSSTITDDVQLTFSGDIGTIGFFVSEGNLRAEDIAVGALGIGRDYATTMTWNDGYNVDGYSNVQYHTPAGLLPFGLSAKVGYAPNMQAGASDVVLSAKNPGVITTTENVGRTLTQIQLGAAPIEGVTLKGDYAYTSGGTGGITHEPGVSGNVQVNYASGPFKIGYTEGGSQPAVAGEITYYENKAYGVSFAVNESLVISYNYDESAKNERTAVARAASVGTKTVKTSEQETYQIAYTMGGMTIGYSMADVSNADYTVGKNENINILSIAMAF